MSITARLSAWWSAWQVVVWLLLALAASLALNGWQWKRAIEAPLKIELADKDAALDDSAALLASSRQRAQALDAAAGRTTILLATAASRYGQAAQDRPLAPNCAPGQARQDAVNMTLGQRDARGPQP